MRFVAVKSIEKQASAMTFKARDLLVGQRTQTINALRGHMAEYGVIAPNGPVHLGPPCQSSRRARSPFAAACGRHLPDAARPCWLAQRADRAAGARAARAGP